MSDLPADKAHAFCKSWEKRSKFSWQELSTHQRHGLGRETLPVKQLKPSPPNWMNGIDKVVVFRYCGNLPVVGVMENDVFVALWIEKEYGEVYDHG